MSHGQTSKLKGNEAKRWDYIVLEKMIFASTPPLPESSHDSCFPSLGLLKQDLAWNTIKPVCKNIMDFEPPGINLPL